MVWMVCTHSPRVDQKSSLLIHDSDRDGFDIYTKSNKFNWVSLRAILLIRKRKVASPDMCVDATCDKNYNKLAQ